MSAMALQRVEFHTGLDDPIGYACRLLRKAALQGVRVAALGPAGAIESLDRALWTFDERDFVPHARADRAAATVLKRSPVWLMAPDAAAAPAWRPTPEAPRVWVNLGIGLSEPVLAHCDRLIELLGLEPDAVQAGRARWRAYRGWGLDVVHHERGAGEGR